MTALGSDAQNLDQDEFVAACQDSIRDQQRHWPDRSSRPTLVSRP